MILPADHLIGAKSDLATYCSITVHLPFW